MLAGGDFFETPKKMVPCPMCYGSGRVAADAEPQPKREPAPPDYSIPVPNTPVPQLPPGELEPSPDAKPLIPPKKKV